jgi:inner membrane protein
VNGRIEHVESKEPTRGYAHFLPASFKADGRLNPERLHRGIYETIVYRGALNLSGSFARPSFEEWGIDPRRVLWNEAEIAVSITDLRGTNESLQMMLGGQMYPLKPGKKLEGLNGVYGRVKGLSGDFETLPFAMSLTLNGSRSLRFAPVGINNDVRLSSSWPDPSFQGAFLPSDRKVGADGFIARWQVSYYGREYPQQWNNANSISAAVITSSLLGVDMASTLDSYRYVERSCKYGVLLIALLFSAFFIFENLSTVRIHPFQYTLVGFALCLFYLGLLALSEVTSFAIAYWIGAAAASLMIALYCVKALQSIKRGCVLAAGLAVIYGFLFVILRMQDFSLLVGTAGLFLALAIVMFVTRNIDWYARDNS